VVDGPGRWGFDLAAAGDHGIWFVGFRIFVNILLGLATWGDSAGASVTVTVTPQHDHNAVINSVMLKLLL